MKTRTRGFTLIELLTVIAIIGILAAIIIPTVGKVRDSAKRSRCMSNVRQITVGLINAANADKRQRFPYNRDKGVRPLVPAGNDLRWAWDVEHTVAEQVINSSGREVLYCPSTPMLQNYTADYLYTGFNANFAISSYVLLIDGTSQISAEYLNEKIQSTYDAKGSQKLPQAASLRPLVVDMVISNSASLDSFENVTVGGLKVNVSNHMSGKLAGGAHYGYVDGHVKWRSFKSATALEPDGFSVKNTGSSPKVWF